MLKKTTNILEERKKSSVDLIDLDRFVTLRGFKQRIVIAEKVNELIDKLNLH